MVVATQDKLYDITDSERWHLEHPGAPSLVYDSTPRIEVEGETVYLFDWSKTLGEKNLAVIKETRFTDVPDHVNSDMELSYVYDGTCDFVIQGRRLRLSRGDIIVFDPNVVRSSPNVKGYRDIVVSVVFKKEFFDSVFLSQLPTGGALTSFLFEYISRRRRHDRYLLIPQEYAGRACTLIRFLMEENAMDDECSRALQVSYVRSLFLELIRGLSARGSDEGKVPNPDENTALVLDYIQRNYKTCSLGSVAEEFGYSANSLGNLLRQKANRSFSEIKLAQQMSEAAYLLLNTDRPIATVAQKVGILNMSFFYNKFKKFYGMTPKAYRLSARTATIAIAGDA